MLGLQPRLALLSVTLGAALGGGVSQANAAEPPPGRASREPTPVTSSFAARRRREVDELRRQDLAQTLADEGIAVRWQDHSLAELNDWRERIEAARALHDQYATDVDWRAVALPILLDMRLRAAKADELQKTYRIAVDWRGYSWGDLERLRVSLAALHPSPAPADRPRHLASWDADALAPFDPARPVARVPMNLYDPDAIIEPLFASESWSTTGRRAGRLGRLDPDAILAPSFEKIPPHIGDGDDLIEPFTTPAGAR